jgi:hypothetical protein
MIIIELSKKLPSLKKILERASRENVLLKTPDGRQFVLAERGDFDREIELTRQNEELMKFLDERSKETKTFTLAQVKQELGIE